MNGQCQAGIVPRPSDAAPDVADASAEAVDTGAEQGALRVFDVNLNVDVDPVEGSMHRPTMTDVRVEVDAHVRGVRPGDAHLVGAASRGAFGHHDHGLSSKPRVGSSDANLVGPSRRRAAVTANDDQVMLPVR
jgi:hypothetical protein